MDVAQTIWLASCPEKGNFSAKKTKNALLTLE
jgi:hypothetical protein